MTKVVNSKIGKLNGKIALRICLFGHARFVIANHAFCPLPLVGLLAFPVPPLDNNESWYIEGLTIVPAVVLHGSFVGILPC